MKKTLVIVCSLVVTLSFGQLEFSRVTGFDNPYGSTLILEDLIGTILWQRTPVPGADEYVQNGLIGMWDARENAGWGIHDNEATVWKNLAGAASRDFILTNGYHIATSYIAFDGSNTNTWAARSASNALDVYNSTWQATKAVECVVAITSFPTQYSFVFWTGGTYVCAQSGKLMLRYCNNRQYPSIGFSYTRGTTVAASWTNNRLRVNGKEISTINAMGGASDAWGYIGYGPGNAKNSRFVGRIYCIRVYNRYLTEDEVLYNYSVDKARFGLP